MAEGCRARAAGAMQCSRRWLPAAAVAGLTGGEGRVLALQNRGQWGFGLAPGEWGTGACHGGLGEAGSVPGDRARSDPFLSFTQMKKGTGHRSERGLRGCFTGRCFSQAAQVTSPCHCWPQ